MNNDVWVLFDDRAGNNNQSESLAKLITKSYQIKHLKYNKFINLPSLLHFSSLIGINKDAKTQIASPWPNIVISAGRRGAITARFIKKQSPTTKLIQIMWPGYGAADFDHIILPEHDNYDAPNIIKIIGALTSINQEMLLRVKENSPRFSIYKEPIIALLVGGKSKGGEFTTEHAKLLIKQVNEIVTKKEATLLVSTSRRTPAGVVELLRTELKHSYFYEYGEQDNPYLEFLAYASEIIITGDSISMCSEACYSGKPVYIFAPKDISSKKHRSFHQNLYAKHHALPLAEYFNESNHQALKLGSMDVLLARLGLSTVSVSL